MNEENQIHIVNVFDCTIPTDLSVLPCIYTCRIEYGKNTVCLFKFIIRCFSKRFPEFSESSPHFLYKSTSLVFLDSLRPLSPFTPSFSCHLNKYLFRCMTLNFVDFMHNFQRLIHRSFYRRRNIEILHHFLKALPCLNTVKIVLSALFKTVFWAKQLHKVSFVCHSAWIMLNCNSPVFYRHYKLR